MKVLLIDKDGQRCHLSAVPEVVVLDDGGNPINVCLQQADLVTCVHAAEAGFAETVRKCGLIPPEVKVVG